LLLVNDNLWFRDKGFTATQVAVSIANIVSVLYQVRLRARYFTLHFFFP
jgi:hypothetical protein